MKIFGNVILDPAGSEISNLRLENLSAAPLTSDGRIYFSTSTKKVYVWNGTSWLQITSSADYYAGDGLSLDPSNKFSIILYDNIANTSGLQFNSGFLQLKVVASEFVLDGSGLSLATGGVTAAHLAGSIPDSKLLQITTAMKVAASAVEPVFLRNDQDDSTTGTLSVKDLILRPEIAPGVPSDGQLYYEVTNNKLYYWNTATWAELYTGTSNVNSVTGTTPIVVAPATGDIFISCIQATTVTDGYLSAADWNIFNSKQPAMSFGNGLDYTPPLLSVKLATIDPALEFDGGGGLGVKLKTLGGILKDVDGLYLAPIFAGFQAVYNADPNRPNARFYLDNGGSFEIRDNTDLLTIFKVDDGTAGTSAVTAQNLIVAGDLDVLGDDSRIRTTELWIKDRSISVGYQNPTTGTPVVNSSFDVLRGSQPTVNIRYNETSLEWEYTNDGAIWYPFNAGTMKYDVPFVGLDTVPVNHNLDDWNPIIQCYDATNVVILPLQITSISANSSVVTFSAPQSGTIAAIGGTNVGGGGGSSGKYTQYFTLPGAGTVVITAVQHGLGNTDMLMIQVMSFVGLTSTIVQPQSTSIDTLGTVTMTFLGAIDGKVIIMK